MGTSWLCTLSRPDQEVSGALYSHPLSSLRTLSASHPSQSWTTGNCLCSDLADRTQGIKQCVRVTQTAPRPAMGCPLLLLSTYLQAALSPHPPNSTPAPGSPWTFQVSPPKPLLGRSCGFITSISFSHLYRFHLGTRKL